MSTEGVNRDRIMEGSRTEPWDAKTGDWGQEEPEKETERASSQVREKPRE